MGEPKLLLPWKGTTLLGHLVAQWQQLGAAQIAAVMGGPEGTGADDHSHLIRKELDRLASLGSQVSRIINPRPEQGMFSSIQCAARWSGWQQEISHWVMTLGDQPHLQSGTLAALIEFAETNPHKICQPSRKGRLRHPVVFPRNALKDLGRSSAPTLKDFLQARPAALAFCEIDDAGLDFDIDTPAAYQRALGSDR